MISFHAYRVDVATTEDGEHEEEGRETYRY
jgi:hypothetical protein